MNADYSRILPWVFAVLIPLMVYRRFRRNFGRQPLNPTRMAIRMAILSVLAALLAPAALRSAAYLSAELAGAAAGVALALWGANRTRFIRQDLRLFYIPHTYTGIAVSALLVGRIVYRLVQMYSTGALAIATTTADAGPADGPASMVRSPLTTGIFFVLIGYYVCYYGLVLWKSKHITAADLETREASSGGEADAVARSDVRS